MAIEQGHGFVRDTLVMIEGGHHREIESVFSGDKVLARCELTGALAYREVLKRSESTDETCYVLFIDDDAAEEFPMEATQNQRFRVSGQGWTNAMDLHPGDVIETHDGKGIGVSMVIPTRDVASVFHLVVAEFHSFFVGGRGLWASQDRPWKHLCHQLAGRHRRCFVALSRDVAPRLRQVGP